MPDDTAAPPPLAIELLDPLQGRFDDKELLITGDLLDAAIEDGELEGQFQQSFRTAETVKNLILLGDQPFTFGFMGVEKGASKYKVAAEELLLLLHRQGRINASSDIGVLVAQLFPDPPELGGRSGRGILGGILVDPHDQLRIDKELGDIVVILVADRLGDRLFHLHIRRLAFDHRQRDAVDKEDDVRPGRLGAAGAGDAEFSGDVEGIPLPVAPVDIVKIEALGVTFNALLQRRPQGDQVVDRFVGLEESVVFDVLEFLDRGLDILFTKEKFAPFMVDAVESLQLVAEDVLQEDIAALALALLHDLFGGEVFVAQTHEELQGGDLGEIFFVEAETGHVFLRAWLRVR